MKTRSLDLLELFLKHGFRNGYNIFLVASFDAITTQQVHFHFSSCSASKNTSDSSEVVNEHAGDAFKNFKTAEDEAESELENSDSDLESEISFSFALHLMPKIAYGNVSVIMIFVLLSVSFLQFTNIHIIIHFT